MAIEILMPALSPTMKEGNLAKWVKKEGDKIKAGEVIAEIETDKATMEVEAVDEGILGKILVAQGSENVAVNTCIALILESGEDIKALDSYQAKLSKVEKSDVKNQTENSSPISSDHVVAKDELKNLNSASNVFKSNPVNVVVEQASKKSTNKTHHDIGQYAGITSADEIIKASPLAKKIAKEAGISLVGIDGTGPHQRIIKDDVIDFIKNGKTNNSNGSNAVVRDSQEYYTIKNNNIRKVIAKRLLESKQFVPHFYLSCELKIDKLLELRSALNEVAKLDEKGNPEYKISVNDLVIKATAMALKKVPEANSAWSNDFTIIYNNVDISMAVAIDGGLITPIIKNADQKSIQQISQETKILAKKAREGKLQPEEFQGGTFSISNLGMYGIDNFSAIINPPQSCILAVSRAVEKPVVEHGQIKIANLMNVSLSADHRVVDGVVGAEFLKALRRYIEHPILNII
ncbi:MAG: pyruvate dehydrogenase complex dihydrolipoamide acetyltransferase [Alphaproteobacteria bacterium]